MSESRWGDLIHRPAPSVVGLLREAVTIIAAAGSAYLGIRVDMAEIRTEQLAARRDVERHERVIEALAAERAARLRGEGR